MANVYHIHHVDIVTHPAQTTLHRRYGARAMPQLLQVRQAARGLGVHENTLRRWEERGLIRAVHLPSGVRRFRTEDIEAIKAQMFSGFPPIVEEELPTVSVENVDR
jgi:excisionase family DNA binding protein